jgi:ubiquitin-like modifier-activating enzyme ATG7
MPGHIVKGSDAVKECHETVAKLEKLIAEHDVVFLLLDSREARWLPTVMATSMGKVRYSPNQLGLCCR